MSKGKNTCKILKDIRRQIAESNDIEFVTSECRYQGDCSGTCPKCEAELRYLEVELNRRQQLGNVITLAGLSIGLSTSLVGCHSNETEGELPISTQAPSSKTTQQVVEEVDTSTFLGDVSYPGWPGLGKEIVLSVMTDDKKNPSVQSPPCTNDFIPLMGDVEIVEPEPDSALADVVYYADEMPEFPGGNEALKSFLSKEIQYPDDAKYYGITGTVLIEFVVERDGSVSNAKVKIPLFSACDEEAIRASMSMPKWKPAKNMGKPVRCFYQVPVSFKMQ